MQKETIKYGVVSSTSALVFGWPLFTYCHIITKPKAQIIKHLFSLVFISNEYSKSIIFIIKWNYILLLLFIWEVGLHKDDEMIR